MRFPRTAIALLLAWADSCPVRVRRAFAQAQNSAAGLIAEGDALYVERRRPGQGQGSQGQVRGRAGRRRGRLRRLLAPVPDLLLDRRPHVR